MNYEYLISFHITPKAPRFFGKIFGKERNPSSLRVTRKAEPLVFQEIPLAEKNIQKKSRFPEQLPEGNPKAPTYFIACADAYPDGRRDRRQVGSPHPPDSFHTPVALGQPAAASHIPES